MCVVSALSLSRLALRLYAFSTDGLGKGSTCTYTCTATPTRAQHSATQQSAHSVAACSAAARSRSAVAHSVAVRSAAARSVVARVALHGRTRRGRALRGRALCGRALRGRALRGRALRGCVCEVARRARAVGHTQQVLAAVVFAAARWGLQGRVLIPREPSSTQQFQLGWFFGLCSSVLQPLAWTPPPT